MLMLSVQHLSVPGPMVVSEKIRGFHASGSAIRKMFDEGLRLKQLVGEDSVADLSIGNPGFPPPAEFSEAMQRIAASAPQHSYMPNAGYPDVRGRVAEHLRRRDLLPGVGAEHIVMTTGAAGALNVTLKTILEPGDEVIVVRPFFVEYRFYIDNHGGRMVEVESEPDANLDPQAVAAAIGPQTRAVIVNSPNNPSGRVYGIDRLDSLAQVLRDASARLGRPVFLLSDEPYREMLFGGRSFVSPASRYENSFQCYSWSKTYSIPGERIGYVAVNPHLETTNWPLLMGALGMCNRFLGFVNAPAFMQRVIAESLDAVPDFAHYEEKKDLLCDALRRGGYRFAEPEGTFYIFPETPGDEDRFVARAKERMLLVVPGSSFGRPGHFRISFAASESTVRLGCRLLEELAA